MPLFGEMKALAQDTADLLARLEGQLDAAEARLDQEDDRIGRLDAESRRHHRAQVAAQVIVGAVLLGVAAVG